MYKTISEKQNQKNSACSLEGSKLLETLWKKMLQLMYQKERRQKWSKSLAKPKSQQKI
jgi:hypothetical protein